MQATMHSTPSLPALLRLTAKAREAFELRRRLTVERPAYQVKAVSRGFYHVVETATEKVLAFRRSYAEALQRADELEKQATQ